MIQRQGSRAQSAGRSPGWPSGWSRDGPQWVGNVTFGAEFGAFRPDLINVGARARLHLFEVKALGSDALAQKDVEFYLNQPTVRSSFVASDLDLIFKASMPCRLKRCGSVGRTSTSFIVESAPPKQLALPLANPDEPSR